MAHAYAHLEHTDDSVYASSSVYGPWGGPDMALFKFTNADPRRTNRSACTVTDKVDRDFTYVDDIASAITLLN